MIGQKMGNPQLEIRSNGLHLRAALGTQLAPVGILNRGVCILRRPPARVIIGPPGGPPCDA